MGGWDGQRVGIVRMGALRALRSKPYWCSGCSSTHNTKPLPAVCKAHQACCTGDCPRPHTHLFCMVVDEAALLDSHRHQLAVLQRQAQPHSPHSSS
jgi:hypothetical protein